MVKAVRLASKKKQSSLETANEMYKTAFRVKRHKFSLESPHLTELQLQEKTIEYFQKLLKD